MRVLLVLNKPFTQDSRAQREINALADRGHCLDVVCFKDPLFTPAASGVIFHSLPICRRRKGRLRYLFEFVTYFAYCLFQSLFLLCRRRYSVMQVFVVPEFMILLTIVPKLFGVRVVTDWMDLGYELYETEFGLGRFDPVPRLVRDFERQIARRSDLVLVPNRAFLRALARRGITVRNALIVTNSADENVFKASPPPGPRGDCLNLLYNGTITYRNGADLAVSSAALAFHRDPRIRLTMVGEARELEKLMGPERIKKAKEFATFTGRIEVSEVAERMRECDIGLIPTRDTPFTRTTVATRIFEFGVMGKPVVCSDLEGIREYFDDTCVLFCRPGDVEGLARCIDDLHNNPARCQRLAANLHERSQSLSWNTMKKIYCDAVEGC